MEYWLRTTYGYLNSGYLTQVTCGAPNTEEDTKQQQQQQSRTSLAYTTFSVRTDLFDALIPLYLIDKQRQQNPLQKCVFLRIGQSQDYCHWCHLNWHL